jgi:subtilase family serine protease
MAQSCTFSPISLTQHFKQKAPSAHPITFILSLRQQNLDKLEELFWDRSNPNSPQYQQWLSIEQINSLVSPPKEQHDAVLSWLKENKAKVFFSRNYFSFLTNVIRTLLLMLMLFKLL